MMLAKWSALTIVGTLTVFSLASSPAAALGAVVGRGDIPVPGCTSDLVPLVARNIDIASVEWRFDYGFGCSNPKFAFGGSWDPSKGGCLPYLFGGSLIFCIGAIPSQGIPTSVTFQLCQNAQTCQAGTATVVRA